jgi:WhiB family redox-sensing transcriptional regulator
MTRPEGNQELMREGWDWRTDAACLGIGKQDGFFFSRRTGLPPRRRRYDHEAKLRGRELCAICSVSPECLAYALRNRIPYGVWGGMTTAERRRLLPRGALDDSLTEEVVA